MRKAEIAHTSTTKEDKSGDDEEDTDDDDEPLSPIVGFHYDADSNRASPGHSQFKRQSTEFCMGFSTAGGKKITVNPEKLAAAKKKLHSETGEENSVQLISSTNCKQNDEPLSPIVGFKDDAESNRADPGHSQFERQSTKFCMGFSTAGGKKITVNPEKLAAAKKKLQLEAEGEISQAIVDIPTPPTIGFSTASGKKIAVKDEALAAAKKKLQLETGEENSVQLIVEADTTSIPTMGFSTASGKKIAVKDEALAAAKKKLQLETGEEKSVQLIVEGDTTSSTNCKQKQNVSLEASELEESIRILLEDEDDKVVEDQVDSGIPTPTMGFSTAGGKKIAVKDEAVAAAKKKLQLETGEEKSVQLIVEGDTTSSTNCREEQDVSLEVSELEESIRILLEDEDDNPSGWTCNSAETDSSFKLYHVQSKGPEISSIKLAIVRVYPIIFFQQVAKLFMSASCFHQREKMNKLKQENLYEKLMPEIEKKVREKFTPNKSTAVSKPDKRDLENANPEELLGLLVASEGASQSVSMGNLSLKQRKQLEEVRIKFEDRVRSDINEEFQKHVKDLKEELNVSPALKVRVIDKDSWITDSRGPIHGIITIWQPNSELMSGIQEGKLYEFSKLKPNVFQPHQEIRMSTTKETVVAPIDIVKDNSSFKRKLTTIKEILTDGFSPLFEEFDTIGIISQIDAYNEISGQTVHFTDQSRNILKVKFWNSLKDAGLEEVFKIGSVVACSNLQWRLFSAQKETAYAQFVSEFTNNPKQSHFQGEFHELTQALESLSDMFSFGTAESKQETPDGSMKLRSSEHSHRSTAKRRYLEAYSDPPSLPPLRMGLPPSKRGRLSKPFIPPSRITSRANTD